MKIGLFLMTKKGFSVLLSLTGKKCNAIDFVCIGKDLNLDNDFSIDIENLCIENNILFCFKDTIDVEKINSDYYIAVAWRWLIEVPNLIILHDSILPRYRGFAPLVNMLINGEKEFGVTAIFANSQYDQGDIILQKKLNVSYPIKIAEAIDKVSNLYVLIVCDLFDLILNNEKIIGIKQEEKNATYSLWLDNEDYFIDWNTPAEKIRRKVDACGTPYEGAKCWLDNEIIIIKEVLPIEDVKIENRVAGKVIFNKDIYPVVVCGNGLLMIKEAVTQDGLHNILPLRKFRTKFK